MKAVEQPGHVHVDHCPRTGKLCLSHRQANHLIRRMQDHTMTKYRCRECGSLHIGHKHKGEP